MKRISALALLAIASMAACTGAISQQPAIKANIPFDFTVGNNWMPAGEYTISSPMGRFVEIRSADLARTTTVVTTQSHNESDSGSKLVFDKYGDQYFLHRVLCPSIASLNLDVPQGAAARKARSRSLEAKTYRAEEILVATR
ncbi:MAG: hypothetical protein ABSG96_12645 [Terracidiphilus sp.]|jgi:hypothetical protein